ncbi:MAG: MarC family protein [Puniceicoccales bacterium]|jgi:multiple antibiotic resistance protein|nr:MarC family protein [Puniceicoccales bacterium]
MPLAVILASFLKLFIIANPAAGIAVLLSLTPGQSARERTKTAAIACAVALGVMAVVVFSGMGIFHIFGVSLQAFKIAGGSFLLIISIPRLLDPGPGKRDGDRSSAQQSGSVAITPLGIPLICGPGMISTALLFGSDYPGPAGMLGLLVAVILALGTLFVILWLAATYSERISEFALTLAGRLTGIYIASAGILIILSGVEIFLEKGAAL